MADLFRRNYKLRIGSIDVGDFDVRFDIDRSLKRSANKATVEVLNLSQRIRNSLVLGRGLLLEFDVGYGNEIHTIFRGDVRDVKVKKDKTEIVTQIEAGDGEQIMRTGRVFRAFPRGTSIKTVVREIIDGMGVRTKLSDQAVEELNMRDGGSELVFGTVLAGGSANLLTTLLRSMGKEWSIQNGSVLILDIGDTLPGEGVLLSHETGLLSDPEISRKGILTAQSLILPGLEPGRRVVVRTDTINGSFRVETVGYSGDSRGHSWFAEIEARIVP